MGISELLNPAAEGHDIFGALDKDIYDAVIEAKSARKQSMLSGDDHGFGTCRARGTFKEALTAAMALWKYMKNLNDPLARKLEAVMSTFGQMTLRGNGEYERHEIFLLFYS
ncbi:hypothetical protein L210DRAFT_977586 [Boletus edulis BED1]|uniref:Uncharacterized protein n=1 Tax=Boletus edulis BED1 TaxID=1328754 RepID=A0AAD4BTT6_BOLED|nr:hypothetical protein L210DRAFT_977586 [Boletus edulis BED1]